MTSLPLSSLTSPFTVSEMVCTNCGLPASSLLPIRQTPICGDCRNEWATSEQARMRRERAEAQVQADIKTAGLPPLITSELQNQHFAPTATLEKIRSIGTEMLTGSPGYTSLLLVGSKGTGKTLAATAIAIDHIRRQAQRDAEPLEPPTTFMNVRSMRPLRRGGVRFAVVSDLMLEVRRTFSRGSDETEADVIDGYRRTGLLILDDLGTSNPSAHTSKVLYDIINHRYANQLPMILTSNYSLAKLARFLSPSEDITEAERLIDRIRAMAFPIELTGPSLRKSVGASAVKHG
jgi:DNA replication protein DnaC